MKSTARSWALRGCPLHSSTCRVRAGASFSTTAITERAPSKNHPSNRPNIASKLEARSRPDSVSPGHDPKVRAQSATGRPGRSKSSVHGDFRSITLHIFSNIMNDQVAFPDSVLPTGDELNRLSALFMNALDQAFHLAEQNITTRAQNPLFWNLRDAFIKGDAKGLRGELKFSFQSFQLRQSFTKEMEQNHEKLLDCRFPHEWFPATRTMQRTIHLHVGPTNSGKTYTALKALENAKTGVYAGPLRLLANEVYQRLLAKGKSCALITGEEVRIPEDTDLYFMSSTVEMVPLNTKFDVAVIDEIQMINSMDRGNAWTSAFLGVQAKEVHLCGEERVVPLIEKLCAGIGDKLVIHRYQRLSPLATMSFSLRNDLNQLKKGDAVVCFSRLRLHILKRKIETNTGKRCAIIYGSLPPEVRSQQASLFNDPDNDYDFVVASDAIGMGLNLEIRRVIFESVSKYDGFSNRILTHPEVKQIGGRAGRYRSARSAVQEGTGLDPGQAGVTATPANEQGNGLVSTMDPEDLQIVDSAFKNAPEDLTFAVLHPPAAMIERFASYFPSQTPLSYILTRLRSSAVVSKTFQLHVPPSTIEVADLIQDLPLTIHDRLLLCALPTNLRRPELKPIVRAYARIMANSEAGNLLSIPEIPLHILDEDVEDIYDGKSAQGQLSNLELLSDAVCQYIWLSYRTAGMFEDMQLAFHIREIVETRLIDLLDRLDFTDEQLKRQRASTKRGARRNKNLEMRQRLTREEAAEEKTNARGKLTLDDDDAYEMQPEVRPWT